TGRHHRRSLRIPYNAALCERPVLRAIEVRSLLTEFSLTFFAELRQRWDSSIRSGNQRCAIVRSHRSQIQSELRGVVVRIHIAIRALPATSLAACAASSATARCWSAARSDAVRSFLSGPKFFCPAVRVAFEL